MLFISFNQKKKELSRDFQEVFAESFELNFLWRAKSFLESNEMQIFRLFHKIPWPVQTQKWIDLQRCYANKNQSKYTSMCSASDSWKFTNMELMKYAFQLFYSWRASCWYLLAFEPGLLQMSELFCAGFLRKRFKFLCESFFFCRSRNSAYS